MNGRDAQLLACTAKEATETEEAPLCYRVLYGLLAREGMRTGEAENLRWSEITWTEDGIAAGNTTALHEPLRNWGSGICSRSMRRSPN